MKYTLTVEWDVDGKGATAYIDDLPTPHRGWGESPLQAIRALCESLREWPIGGADRWLHTPDGQALTRKFGLEPKKPMGES